MNVSSEKIWKGIRRDFLASVAGCRLPVALIAVVVLAFIFNQHGIDINGLKATLHDFWVLFGLISPLTYIFATDFDFARGFFEFRNCVVIRFEKISLRFFFGYITPLLPVPTSPPRQLGRTVLCGRVGRYQTA